jgi:hypothetical protein
MDERIQKYIENNPGMFITGDGNINDHEFQELRKKLHETGSKIGGFGHAIVHTKSDLKEIDNKELIETLVQTYKKDGAKIRDILKKTGYTNAMELAFLLQGTIGRGKGRESLYRGLPSEKKVMEYWDVKKLCERNEEERRHAAWVWKDKYQKHMEEEYLKIAPNLAVRKMWRANVLQKAKESAFKGFPWPEQELYLKEFAAQEEEEAEAIAFITRGAQAVPKK